MSNQPDWKYGDILRPRGVGFIGYGYEATDRVMFLTFDNEIGSGWITSLNLTIAVDNETWISHVDTWELDADA